MVFTRPVFLVPKASSGLSSTMNVVPGSFPMRALSSP